eukprot:Em0037g29a
MIQNGHTGLLGWVKVFYSEEDGGDVVNEDYIPAQSKHELKEKLNRTAQRHRTGYQLPQPPPQRHRTGFQLPQPPATTSGLGTSVDQTHTPDEETLDSPNIVPLTPVVRPVDVILSSPRNNIFFGSNKEDREEEEGRSQQQNLQGGDELEEERIEQEKEQEEERENTRIKNERDLQYEYAKKLAKTAGLPTYKFDVPIRKKADRDKLDAKACPDCQKWFQLGVVSIETSVSISN